MIIILGLVGFVAFLLIIALFLKKEYSVQHEITINKPAQEVFNYVKLLKNQKYYNKWVMMDPNLVTQDTGTDGTIGFFSAWKSQQKNLGQGEQTIKGIIDGKQVDLEIRFIKPFEGLAQVCCVIEPVSANASKVSWGLSTSMKYPRNLMLGLSKKVIGGALAEGLAILKKVLEK
jgi:Ca2+/Na+ antiporter